MNAGSSTIKHLFISEGHNFVGQFGKPPNTFLPLDQEEILCKMGSGIVGDRYFDHKPDYIGQITFFEMEVYEEIRTRFGVPELIPSAFRRNVLTVGIDLNQLIGQEFELQGVRFQGTQEARPCKWMESAVAPGAKAALEGHGGLRARILSDGPLRKGACELRVLTSA